MNKTINTSNLSFEDLVSETSGNPETILNFPFHLFPNIKKLEYFHNLILEQEKLINEFNTLNSEYNLLSKEHVIRQYNRYNEMYNHNILPETIKADYGQLIFYCLSFIYFLLSIPIIYFCHQNFLNFFVFGIILSILFSFIAGLFTSAILTSNKFLEKDYWDKKVEEKIEQLKKEKERRFNYEKETVAKYERNLNEQRKNKNELNRIRAELIKFNKKTIFDIFYTEDKDFNIQIRDELDFQEPLNLNTVSFYAILKHIHEIRSKFPSLN